MSVCGGGGGGGRGGLESSVRYEEHPIVSQTSPQIALRQLKYKIAARQLRY